VNFGRHIALRYCKWLRQSGRTRTDFLATSVTDILFPTATVQFDKREPDASKGIAATSLIATQYPAGLPVPAALQHPFEAPNRSGKGSFQKKHPKEILKERQWFISRVGCTDENSQICPGSAAVDDVTRELLGLPEVGEGVSDDSD
jgi:hypothetical protein